MGGRSVRSATRAISWWLLPVLVSGLLTAGCAATPGDHYDVYVDRSFDERVPAVLAGLEDWEVATGVSFNVMVVGASCPDDPHSICIRPATRNEVDDMCGYKQGADLDGCTSYHGASIDSALTEVVADVPLDVFRDGVRHEIGHALGLRHDPQHPSAVMSPVDNGRRLRVTCYDVAQFDDVRGRPSMPCPSDAIKGD